MRIALIGDTFPPARTSGAVQLRDLARELVRQGHELTVMLPRADIASAWSDEHIDGARVLSLRAPKTKDIGYLRRTIAEFLMPLAMLRNLRRSPVPMHSFDGVVWYSPSIFFGPVAKALKRASGCKSYLIIRDIFPEWAVDMGLMGRGLPYQFFNAVAQYQYSVADTIGVQTPGNLVYFSASPTRHVEVLQNWLQDVSASRCSIEVARTALHGRKVFVYAGNMGVAQGMGVMLDLASRLLRRPDIGFLFVGRGSDAQRLAQEARCRQLSNVVFCDEIDPDEIPGLYGQCHFGLVALDPRHKTHNIPGKFLTYIQSGLPVLACINPGNDLVDVIRTWRVGEVATDHCAATLEVLAEKLADTCRADPQRVSRCRLLFKTHFSAHAAVQQIVRALQGAQEPATSLSVLPPELDRLDVTAAATYEASS